MRSRGRESHQSAAEILAVLSRISTKRGDSAQACARLIECLGLLKTLDSERAGGIALGAAADLAAAAGQPERAVEFYGASERVLRKFRTPESPPAAEERAQALDRLRGLLGPERFEAAWTASRASPFPYEYYVSAALHWLEELEASLPQRLDTAAGGGSAAPAEGAEIPGTTAALITQTRSGSPTARERLAGRYLGALRRFAHGRLPGKARDLMDTDDLVQVTVVRALDRVGAIESKRKGSFFAYLRRILTNQVREEIRRSSKMPQVSGLSEFIQSGAPSPLDETLQRESLEAYQAALSRLPVRQREALVLRIENGFSYQNVADAIGCPSANAARMVVSRSLASVAKHLRRR